MEPNRFDDVESRIVEEPTAPLVSRPEPRRLGTAAIAVVAAFALPGSPAAGASALTSTAQAPTRAAAESHAGKRGHGWAGQRHHRCHKGEGARRSSAGA